MSFSPEMLLRSSELLVASIPVYPSLLYVTTVSTASTTDIAVI